MPPPTTLIVLALTLHAAATPIIYDGRAPLTLTNPDLDASTGPYSTVVKGSQSASHYTRLLGPTCPPTPLWNRPAPLEQALALSIDNTSIFVPGSGPPQAGFRRTELLAQLAGSPTAAVPRMEAGTTAFHVSVKQNAAAPLNFSHEYQIVFIEPADGTHVFAVQLGSPFTIPTAAPPAPSAHALRVLDHALHVLFAAPFSPSAWHNLAVQVDWAARTLAVLYSAGGAALQPVVGPVPNPTAPPGAAGQGDFHFGLLKLPLADPADSAADQSDVAHHGIQEGAAEGLLYSGVFVESVADGISVGGGGLIPPL